jgi:hypothetical protein
MRSRERVDAAFAHGEPDRTPIMEYVLVGPVAERILGRRFIDYATEPERWLVRARDLGFDAALRSYVVDRIDLAERLGHDLMYVCPNPVPGGTAYYDPVVIGSTSGSMEDPVEALKRRNGFVSKGLAVSRPPDRSLCVYRSLREEMDRRGLDLPILAPAYFHGIWSDTDLMETIVLDEAVAKEHFRLATERALRLIEAYLEIGIELIGIGGDFAGAQLIISPEAYRAFIVPEVRRLSTFIRDNGRRSVNATDGNLWSVIDDFLLGCGADGYLEIDMGAGMDLGLLKARYGMRITFLGNMDCGRVLSFSSPGEIAEITKNILDAGKGSGGHVFTASNAIMPTVPFVNYVAMVNAYRDYFGLSRFEANGGE